MRPYLERAAETGRSQIAAIGVAQETQRVFLARKRDTDPGKCPQFSFDKKDRRVTVYYFYLWDAGFGPAFIKACTYCPWPVKVWVNGHEWAKQQARNAGSCSPSCPMGSPPAMTLPSCRGSVTRCSPARSACSSSAGCTGCRFRLASPTRRPALVGAVDGPGRGVPHHRVCPAPPRPQLLRRLVTDNLDLGRPDTIEIIFGRRSAMAGSAPPRERSRPRSSPEAWTSPSTPSTSTPASSSTSKTAAPCAWRPW